MQTKSSFLSHWMSFPPMELDFESTVSLLFKAYFSTLMHASTDLLVEHQTDFFGHSKYFLLKVRNWFSSMKSQRPKASQLRVNSTTNVCWVVACGIENHKLCFGCWICGMQAEPRLLGITVTHYSNPKVRILKIAEEIRNCFENTLMESLLRN